MYEIELRAQGIDSMPTAPRRQQLPYIVITYSVRAFDYSFFSSNIFGSDSVLLSIIFGICDRIILAKCIDPHGKSGIESPLAFVRCFQMSIGISV
jgi:hypothetical protein